MKESVIRYLTETYHPLAILLYGSYADGTNDETSDFDCMIIVEQKQKNHDASVVEGVPLDCYIFTEEETKEEEADTFLTVYHAQIVQDNGAGAALKRRVTEYVDSHSVIDSEEKKFISAWIRKTCRRIGKGDEEGSFRAFALMGESLADYCLLRDRFYFGSKKTIRYLKEADLEGYKRFCRAMKNRDNASIIAWLEYVAA